MPRRSMLLPATAMALVAVAVTAGVAGAAVPAPSAARGRQLYFTVGCVHCHGSAGQGSNAGARIAPGPLPPEALAAFIRATNTGMPAYAVEVLSDADVADIAAYLRTIPAARPADSIPALRSISRPGG